MQNTGFRIRKIEEIREEGEGEEGEEGEGENLGITARDRAMQYGFEEYMLKITKKR